MKKLVLSAYKIGFSIFKISQRSLIYNRNNVGPKTDHWGTPQVIGSLFEAPLSCC